MIRSSATPRIVLSVDVVLVVAAFAIGPQDTAAGPIGLIFQVIFALMVLGLGIIGSLIVARQPDNRVGWLFLVTSVGIGIASLCFNYASLSHDRFGLSLPGTTFVAWVSNWIMIPNLIGLVIFVPLLFPTGHLPSPRWRPLAIFGLVGTVVTTIGSALVPGPIESVGIDNPVGIALPHPLVDILGALDVVSGLLLFSLTAAAVVSRYRHGTPLERLQLRWFAYPATIGIALLSVSSIGDVGPLGDVAWGGMLICLAALPIAVGIAILRHRLFDIDLVIKRTISYGVLSVLLIGIEVVGILVLQELLTAVVEQETQTFAIALSTLVVAGLFHPARRRIQGWVDRRFDRSRYDAAQVVAGFSSRLRGGVNLDAVRAELTMTATTALRPTSATVWLRRRHGDDPAGGVTNWAGKEFS